MNKYNQTNEEADNPSVYNSGMQTDSPDARGRHQWEPTDNQGQEIECPVCGMHISIDNQDTWDSNIDASCPGTTLITCSDISFSDELLIEDDSINGYIDLSGALIKRFNLNLVGDDSANIYADYNPDTEELVMSAVVKRADDSKDENVVLDNLHEYEKCIIVNVLEAYCKSREGISLADLFNSLTED